MSLETLRIAILVALDGFKNLKEVSSLTGGWEMSELDIWQRPNDVLHLDLQYAASVRLI